MSVETRFHRHSDGALTIERWQDCEDIVEANKARQNLPRDTGDFRLTASIPNVILERWMNEHGVNLLALPGPEFAAFVRRKLSDPDWKWLRAY